MPVGNRSESATAVSAMAPGALFRMRTRITDVPLSATVAGVNDFASDTVPVIRVIVAAAAETFATPGGVLVTDPIGSVLIAAPAPVGVVTLTETVQLVAPTASVPPASEIVLVLGAAVTVPAQFVATFGFVDTT